MSSPFVFRAASAPAAAVPAAAVPALAVPEAAVPAAAAPAATVPAAAVPDSAVPAPVGIITRKPTVHSFFFFGDTLLVLRKPNAPFAEEKVVQYWFNAPQQNPAGQTTADVTKEELEDPATTEVDAEVHFRLSSHHLKLASPYFGKMMAHGWKETEPKDGYSYNVTAEDWSEKALKLLMNIIHGQTTLVPRVVDLEMLAKIAVLVDYYGCRTAVHFFAESWIERLGPLPSSCGRTLTLRLFVAIVFQEAETFFKLSQIVISESGGPIDPLGLAIPEAVITALDAKRQSAISVLLLGLNELRSQLSAADDWCTFECSSMTLGALIKGMKSMGVGLMPPAPYLGLSFSGLSLAIKKLKSPSYNSIQHIKRIASNLSEREIAGTPRRCSLQVRLETIDTRPPVGLRLSEIPGTNSIFSSGLFS